MLAAVIHKSVMSRTYSCSTAVTHTINLAETSNTKEAAEEEMKVGEKMKEKLVDDV